MYSYFDSHVRCLACGTVFDQTPPYIDGFPNPCPERYLSPHTEDFMQKVAEALERMGALDRPTRAQHEAAIAEAMGE